MKKAYTTLLTPLNDKENTVLVEVPDFEILTEGFGIENAIYMARDAIGLTGITWEDEGRPLPEPTTMKDINEKKGAFSDKGETLKTLVDIDFLEYRKLVDNKSVRRNVTIPNWLNRAAENENLNVSRILQEALMEKLNVAK